jgi:NAD-dependent deacetylase
MFKEKLKNIAKAIFESNSVMVLTGAGISTESGIPDFRSPGGIWSRFDASIMTRDKLYDDPAGFYRQALQMLDFFEEIKDASPNQAHYVLAEMEGQNIISGIITQNIDGLHLKAGSEKVYEVHGNLREGHCISCGEKISFDFLVGKVRSGSIPPLCDSCGGILRPDVVLFGDELPDCFIKAAEEVRNCDVLLVVGSSLEIVPAGSLPAMAKKYIIINKGRTHFDRGAYEVWYEKAGDALEEIFKEIKLLAENK